MNPLVPGFLAAALLICPSVDPSVLRLGRLGPQAAAQATRRRVLPRRWGQTMVGRHRGAVVVVALGGGMVAVAAGGWAAGVTAAVLLGLGGHSVRGRLLTRRRDAESDAVLETLDAFTGELRAGRSPAHALRAAVDAQDIGCGAAAADRPGGVIKVLLPAAATAELGGDVPGALRGAAVRCPPDVARAFDRIAAGWQVSERSGASLGSVLERVALDLRARRRHQRQVAAHLAGPRATGMLLALLPGFGVLLGTAMGAAPLVVLFHTPPGQVALVAGLLLEVAGVAWTARILRHGGGP